MSSTLLEVTRAAHEEVERLERLIVKDLQTEPQTNKDRLSQSHRVRSMMDQIIVTTHRLIEIYGDKDDAPKDEIAALGGHESSTSANNHVNNAFIPYYERLKEIREYHKRHPAAARYVDTTTTDHEYEEELLKVKPPAFTGEEAFGRHLDLHELYNEYINSKFGQQIDYSAYLDGFSEVPGRVSRKLKLTRQYREYMRKLVEYLVYFFERTQPLQDVERIFSKVVVEFEEQWSNDRQEEATIDLDYYSTVEELMEEVGGEKLKEALSALGLKTGGTVRQRAERLFLTKHTPVENLDQKHCSPQLSEDTKAKEIALMEAKMKKLCDLLCETIVRTKENIEKKQALTYYEIVQEREEEEEEDEESDEEDEGIYNPLKFPMGWDGRPIPHWLYKLHGLGHKFKCEICGNHTYRGRRAYERHFKEGRHQHGMVRCLGIPNTKNFYEITSIEEAQQLWKKIQEKQGLNKWHPDLEEEYEDQEGNIYNKKTYTDLRRQGLI